MTQIEIKRKEGWILNPDDKTVNSIIKAIGRNDGHCPCYHPERQGNDICPCESYLEHDECYCGLYVKKGE